MLYYPLDPNKSFVKRVIAEEGDVVRIVDGKVYVNDTPMRDDFVPPEYRSHDDYGPTVVPEGYYFVMGDHRNNSSDSRHWGMVPKKYIIGKVQVRWWPVPDGAHLLTPPARGGSLPGRRGRSRPRPLPESRRRGRQARAGLRHRCRQRRLGRVPLADRLLLERRRAGRRARRAQAAGRSTIRTATGSTRRWRPRRSPASCWS